MEAVGGEKGEQTDLYVTTYEYLRLLIFIRFISDTVEYLSIVDTNRTVNIKRT